MTLNTNNGIYVTPLSEVTELFYAPAEGEAAGRYFKTLSRGTQSAALGSVSGDSELLPPPYEVLQEAITGLTVHPGKAGNHTRGVQRSSCN